MKFEVLPHHTLREEVALHRPEGTRMRPVSLEDPAIAVMTDLKLTSAVTIRADESIESAERIMIQRAVRMLLVVDLDERVQGLLTATDIIGEKPIRAAAERKVKHKDLEVRDLMTSAESIDVLRIADVARAHVGDVVETLKNSHRQHALVVDHQGYRGEQTLRGIFSLTHIARQLGVPVRKYEVADTLAEIAHHTRG